MADVETRISEPLGFQSPDVLEWSRSLRDRSQSPSGQKQRSRSQSPSCRLALVTRHIPRREQHENEKTQQNGAYLTEVPRAQLTSSFPKKSASQARKTDSARKSDSALRRSTGNMAGSLKPGSAVKKSGTLDNIEAEYIKNLQQQIYFLELESNYLREQARKATDLHPKMSAEAERMLTKLRQMQAEMDGLQLENKRKESSIGFIETEKEKLAERLRDEEASRTRDKRMLMEEIVELKKNTTKIEAEGSYKDGQLIEARSELEKSATALKNAELKIQTLRTQLDQRIEQHKMAQIALDEKRSELLSTETQLRSMEEKYYNSTVTIQDKVTNDLRDEVRILRQRLKEAELTAEQERHLRSKMSDDSSNIVRENASLNQQFIELQKQLERERNLRDENESRHSTHVSEMVQVKDREKDLRFELEYTKEQLKKEQDRCRQYQEQMMQRESVSTSQELQINTARSRVTELESIQETFEKDNMQLRKDKSLLIEHVADLQKKLDLKSEEVIQLSRQISTMESRLEDIEQLKNMESTVNSQKWGEFEKLAESMRTLSRTMAQTSSPRTSTRLLQY